MLSMMYGKNQEQEENDHLTVNNNNKTLNNNNNNLNLKSPTSPKLWTPLSNSSQITPSETISGSSIGVKTIQERILKSPSHEPRPPTNIKGSTGTKESKPVQDHLHWDNLTNALSRPLLINDLDFTDLKSDDDQDIFQSNFDNIDYFQVSTRRTSTRARAKSKIRTCPM